MSLPLTMSPGLRSRLAARDQGETKAFDPHQARDAHGQWTHGARALIASLTPGVEGGSLRHDAAAPTTPKGTYQVVTREVRAPKPGTRTAIFDVDETLVHAAPLRAQHDAGQITRAQRHDTAIEVDTPPVGEIVDAMRRAKEQGLSVVVATARPPGDRDRLGVYFRHVGVPVDALFTRPDTNFDIEDDIVKRAMVARMRALGWDPVVSYDDKPDNVAMFHEEGIPAVHVQGKAFDPAERRDAHGRWTRGGGTVLDSTPVRTWGEVQAQVLRDHPDLAERFAADAERERSSGIARLKDGYGGFGSEEALRAAFETPLPEGHRSAIMDITEPHQRSLGFPITVNGKILDSDGNDAGYWERTLYPSQGMVSHDTLTLAPGSRHKGIGTAFVKHTTAAVEVAGYRKINVYAAGPGYYDPDPHLLGLNGWRVWAKPEFGFRFDDSGREKVHDVLAALIEESDRSPEVKRLLRRLSADDPAKWPTPAQVLAVEPEAMSDGWSGERPLAAATKSYLDDGMLHLECIPGPSPRHGSRVDATDTEGKSARRHIPNQAARTKLMDNLAAQDAEDLRGAEEDVRRAILDALDRQERTVIARLTGTKARRNTRHWDPPGEQKIDPRYVLDLAKWRLELADAVRPALQRSVAAGARSVARRLGLHDDITLPGADLAVTGAVQRIITGLLARFLEIQQIITQAEVENLLMDQIEAKVREAYTRKQSWATRAASDETVGAYNTGSMETAQRSGKVLRKMWLSSRDERVRESHRHADGQTQLIANPFLVGGFTLQYPGDPTGPPQEVFNCFPDGTLVQAHGVSATMRRWYSGAVVTVRMGEGRVLTGTPNHPVLTSTGWMALKDLTPGQHLVGARLGQDVAVGHPDVEHGPAPIEQVVAASAQSGHVARIAGAGVQFHGDGADGEVEVVRADRVLGDDGEAALGEPGIEQVLTRGYAPTATLGATREFIGADGPTAGGAVGSGGVGTALFGRSVLSEHPVSSGAVTEFDVALAQASGDQGATDAEIARELCDAGAVEVALYEILDVEFGSMHGGWVSNLETVRGWYTASGVVCHNCRCTLLYEAVDR